MGRLTLEKRLEKLEKKIKRLEAERDKFRHERDEYRKLYELLFIENERLRRNIFGQKAERVPKEQLALDFPDVAEAISAFEDTEDDKPRPNSDRRDRKPSGRKPTGRKPLPEDLPVERIELKPPEVEQNPDDFVKIGEEVTETLERRPASFVRVQVVRPKFKRKSESSAEQSDEETPEFTIADVPELPITRGLAGPGLLAHVVICKYADHLPLHRLEGIFARDGIELARSTMCGWIEKTAQLAKLVVDAMLLDAKNAPYIAIDATGVLVQAPNKCKNGHFWVMIAERKHVLFRYSRHHDSAAVDALLDGYQGIVVADAHGVYDHLFADNTMREAACWSHCRRYFFNALSSDPDRAKKAIGMIKPLFLLERKLADAPRKKRERVRRQKAAPITKKFFDWCESEQDRVLDDTPISKAINYALNQRKALRRFLEDGRIPIHNNFSELQLRHEVVGRKNWLFLGSEDGAEWNTTFVSLIASCKLHDIEPWAYLRDLFCLLPSWNQRRVLELAPAYWKQTLENTDAQKILDSNIFRRVTLRDSLKHREEK